jgi:hypothetical protein
MPNPSRRLVLFCAVLLIVLAAPMAFFVFMTVRAVFQPPVDGTRFLSYDGLHLDGSCANQPSTKGGQVLACNFQFHIDSRFVVINHDIGAVAWCVQRVDEAHFLVRPSKSIGPLLVGNMPTVPSDWNRCADIVPRRTGFYADLVLRH